jgi:hypothetical protein
MPDYRAYLIDRNDRVIARKDIVAPSDEAALEAARLTPRASTSRYGTTRGKWDGSAKSKGNVAYRTRAFQQHQS